MPIRNLLITVISYGLRLFFRERPFPQNAQTIIVIKPCCLGDVINATPTLAALRHYFPEAKIEVAVGRWSRAVLANNPRVSRLIDSGRVGQGHYTLADVWHLSRLLRAERYSAAIVLDRSPLVGLVPALAGIPHRVGLDSQGRGFAHTLRVPVPVAPRHEALIYLDCAQAASGQSLPSRGDTGESPPARGSGRPLPHNPTNFWTEFYPTTEDKQALENILAEVFGGQTKRLIAVLHPGGGVNPGMTMLDKRWPPDRYAVLANRLRQRGLAIALTGTVDDAPLCAEIAFQMQHQPAILAGRLTLGQFGALCQQARLFVGGDTGGTHLAAACGCRAVAIFGPSDPTRYAPFAPSDRSIVLWRKTSVPSGGVVQGTIEGFDWKQGVTVAEAWEACQQLLAASVSQDNSITAVAGS